MRDKFILWLLGCFLVTLFCGLVYISTQQIIRLSANESSMQLASVVSSNLKNNKSIKDAFPSQRVDAFYDYAPFVVIYDSNRNIIATNATAMRKTFEEKPPIGVFEFVNKNSQEKFTWVPVSSFRYTAVMQKADLNGEQVFVLSAKSLGYVEKLENQILIYAGFAWILGILAVSLVTFLLSKSPKKK